MKNILLFAALTLTSVVGVAQLTVKPTSGADSYVYVKDQILYVKGGIHLEKNNVGDTEASIYLRDQGQLIQGGTTSANSGNGFLSVRQISKHTNAFAYRYWSSPVSQPIGSGNKNFGVELLYDHLEPANLTKALQVKTLTGRDGERGTTTTPMKISTRWLYTHITPGTENEDHYVRMNAGYNAPAGYGFTMKGVGLVAPGEDQTYEFRGRPNNGDFTINVGFDGEPLMTLSGNPYPSALDLNKVFYYNKNLPDGNERLGSFRYYDEDRSVASHLYREKPYGYGVWVPLSEDPSGNNPGVYTAAPFFIWNSSGNHSGPQHSSGFARTGHRFAPIGQGIMFMGGPNAGTTSPIEIKNSHRVYVKENTQTSIFYRPGGDANTLSQYVNGGGTGTGTGNSSGAASELDQRMPQIRLYVVFNDAVTRDMVLLFSNQATEGYDRGLDGHSPRDLKTDAYFPIGTQDSFDPYVIHAVKFEDSRQVPINFSLNKETKIEVRLIEEIKKPYEKAYLYDKQENSYRELSRVRNAISAFYLPAGEHNNRFFIVFYNPNGRKEMPEAKALAREEVLKNVTFFQDNPNRNLEVRNPDSYNVTSAALYDMNGRMVAKEQKPGKENQFSFYTGNLSDGIYLVKLITDDNITIDHKVVVHNK